MSPVVLKAMKKGNLKSFVSGERSRALWALLFNFPPLIDLNCYNLFELFEQAVIALEGPHVIQRQKLEAI